jgi:16S rRNA G966 N2-methylase RsmD
MKMTYDPGEAWRSIYRENKRCDGFENYYDDESVSDQFSENPYMWKDGEERCLAIGMQTDWTVLDIGAGAGSMTVPLARICKRVTAVEPSKTMVRILSSNLKKAGLDNVQIINSRWEDAPEEIERHDIVIAAYSLMIDDIEKAVLRMNSLARKKVYLYWFAGVPYWERHCLDLWSTIYGYEYTPSPKVDLVFAVLYKHGIYPDVVNLDNERPPYGRVMNTEQAMDELKDSLHLKGNDEWDELLMRYIEDNYEKKEDGCWSRGGSSRMRISWSPQL